MRRLNLIGGCAFNSGSRGARLLAAGGLLLLAAPAAALAAEAGAGNDTAQQLSNPISSLISVPFENNFAFGKRGSDDVIWTQNIQPVIPIKLTDDLSLISRTIIPIESENHADGLGDLVQSLFLSPKSRDGFTFGAGPVLVLPTETDKSLGLHQVGLGPTAVAVKIVGPLLSGVLVNHVWNVDHTPSGRERLNNTLVEPFLSYTFPTQTSLTLVSPSTYDTTARRWTIPITFTVNQLFKIQKQAVQFGVGPTYYARTLTEPSSRWGLQFTLTLVYPTKK